MSEPTRVSALALATVLALALISVGCARTADRSHGSLAPLGFLAGRWSGATSGGEFRAHYTAGSPDLVMSYSELLRDGEPVFYEFERFSRGADGWTFHPYPGGNAAIPLKLTRSEPGRAVFTNPNKDFPTQIEYHLAEPNRLVITLSDPNHDSNRIQTFDLRRVMPR